MKRFCLALDLKNDPASITEYERWHRNVWTEIRQSILDAGITDMQIYRKGNRLFMIIDAEASFSFENKAAMDAGNPKVQQWEDLMSEFQQPLPWAKEGEKWVVMNQIFQL